MHSPCTIFELDEFTRSATATAHGIDNSLNPTKAGDRNVIENLQHLCQTVLEPLREFVNAPVVVVEETFDQLILETKGNRRWIHVSCCRDESRNRQTCLTKKAC